MTNQTRCHVPLAHALPPPLLARFFRQSKFRRAPPPATGATAVLAPTTPHAAGEAIVCVDPAVRAILRARPLAPPPAALPMDNYADIRTLHADSRVIVICKPPGVHCQAPGTGVLGALPSIAARHGAEPGSLRLVHRIDTPVGGLLCLARTLDAARRLGAELRGGAERGGGGAGFSRAYLGLVVSSHPAVLQAPPRALQGVAWGGLVRAPISQRGGQEVGGVTRWRVAVQAQRTNGPGDSVRSTLTVLLLAPVTGRKHQLRQHVAKELCGGRGGLLGDVLYGGAGIGGSSGRRGGHFIALHAGALRIAGGVMGEGVADVEVVDEALPEWWLPTLREHGVEPKGVLEQLRDFVTEGGQ